MVRGGAGEEARCAKLGTENPRLEDLKLLALAPGANGLPNFQFPWIWDLADPAGYYQKVVLPRQNKAMARLLNKQLHKHVTRERKPDHRKTAGPTEADNSGVPPEEQDKSGKGPRLTLKTEVPKTGEASQAYPAGKRLSPAEVKRSIAHAPQCQKTKKPICWDAACHIDCQRSLCSCTRTLTSPCPPRLHRRYASAEAGRTEERSED